MTTKYCLYKSWILCIYLFVWKAKINKTTQLMVVLLFALKSDPQVLKDLVSAFSSLVNQPEFSDLTIKTKGDTVLYAHRVVLYVRCPSLLKVNTDMFFFFLHCLYILYCLLCHNNNWFWILMLLRLLLSVLCFNVHWAY